MADHKTFGQMLDVTATGKATRTLVFDTANNVWPARPSAGWAVIWSGPATAANPTDFLSGDLRVKY